jgi:hypothetical protein
LADIISWCARFPGRLSVLRRRPHLRRHLRTANENARIDPERPTQKPQNHYCAEPQPASAARKGRAAATPVFNIVGGAKVVDAHGLILFVAPI